MEKLVGIVVSKNVSKTLLALGKDYEKITEAMYMFIKMIDADFVFSSKSNELSDFYNYKYDDMDDAMVKYAIYMRRDIYNNYPSVKNLFDLGKDDNATMKDYVYSALVDYLCSWTAGG
jgi:hypothetical protein